ncbi:MAG: PorT family protein [Cyclobacteriaceae bacterium]|nr:PorT family protein [Cyclobacteriaceae bacterium]
MHFKSKFLASLFLGFLLISATSVAVAQDSDNGLRVGIKGGLNVTNLYVDDVDDENPRYGFHLGVYTQLFQSDVFAIQPEILYSTKGTRIEDNSDLYDATLDFNLNYIDIPVLAVFKLGDAAEIHVGPYFGYLLNANVDVDGDVDGSDDIDRDNFKSWDYGISAGVGFNVGPVQLGARYNYGLQKIADSDLADGILGDSKNSNAQVYVSFNFNQK